MNFNTAYFPHFQGNKGSFCKSRCSSIKSILPLAMPLVAAAEALPLPILRPSQNLSIEVSSSCHLFKAKENWKRYNILDWRNWFYDLRYWLCSIGEKDSCSRAKFSLVKAITWLACSANSTEIANTLWLLLLICIN